MWVMTNTINPQFNHFVNSANNSSENINSSKQNKMAENNSQKTSPIQFGFNFYFDNIKSSPFTPINSMKEQYCNKNNNMIPSMPIVFLFKSSLEKSGFKLTNDKIINSNEIHNEHNNYCNYYEDMNYANFPMKTNYPINNNNIINNFYPTFTKVTNVKILSDNNKKEKVKKNENNLNNLENKKENINRNILSVNIYGNEKKKEKENKTNLNKDGKNNVIINKSIKDNKDDITNKKAKIIFECSESKVNGMANSKIFLKKKRLRKNNEQIVLLSKFYMEHKNWSKKEIKEISENIGLKENKIYKWLWDQKNKEYKATKFIVNKNDNN